MKQETFAFGDNRHDGKACPVVAATGEKPDYQQLTVAEHYDDVVQDWYGLDEGVLPASVAKLCWEEAIRRARQEAKDYKASDEEHSDWLHVAADKGQKITETVF